MGERGDPVGGGGGRTGVGPPSRADMDLAHDQATAQKDSWVLATIDSWVSAGFPKEDTVRKIMESFSLTDLRDAANELRVGDWCVPKVAVTQEGRAGPGYSRKLAEKVYDGLVSIQNQVPLKVHFWVSADDLLKVPGARQYLEDQLDSQAVAARLAGVDAQMGLMMEKLKAAEQLQVNVVELAKTVTGLKAELKESQKVQQQQTGTLKEATSAFEKAAALFERAVPQQVAPVKSWADRVTGSQSERQSRVRTLKDQANAKNRSTSSKRGLESDDDLGQNPSQRQRIDVEEELRRATDVRTSHQAAPNSALSQSLHEAKEGFVEVRRKRRGTVAKGSSTVQAEGGEKPPYSVFLSGTSITTSDSAVKEKLSACYAALNATAENNVLKGFEEVLKVEEIPLRIPQGEKPRSKCWKVTVSAEFAEHMSRGEAYPQAWSWRKWHPGPRTAATGKSSAVDGGA